MSRAGGSPRVALAALLVASTLTVMAGAVLSPVLELIRRDLALSDTGAGLVLTVHGFSLAIVAPLVGRAIDRCSVRPTLVWGLLLSDSSRTLHCSALPPPSSASAWVSRRRRSPSWSRSSPAPLRGRATSLSASATFLGQAASPLFLGPVVSATSVATGFAVAAALAGATLLTAAAGRAGTPARLAGRARRAPEGARRALT